MQRMSFSDLRELTNHARQAKRRKRRKQRSANRHGPDDGSVRIYTSAELNRQKHCGAAGERRRKQQKRKRSPRARPSKQQQGNDQKARNFQKRLPKQRKPEQRSQCIYRSDQRSGGRRKHPDPNAHPCRRKQIYAAVHQRVVQQKWFDRYLHATRITMTVISSDPPLSSAILINASPVFCPERSIERIASSTPSGSTSCTPSEQRTIRSFR